MESMRHIYEVGVRRLDIILPERRYPVGNITSVSHDHPIQEVVLTFQSQVEKATQERANCCWHISICPGYRFSHIAKYPVGDNVESCHHLQYRVDTKITHYFLTFCLEFLYPLRPVLRNFSYPGESSSCLNCHLQNSLSVNLVCSTTLILLPA